MNSRNEEFKESIKSILQYKRTVGIIIGVLVVIIVLIALTIIYNKYFKEEKKEVSKLEEKTDKLEEKNDELEDKNEKSRVRMEVINKIMNDIILDNKDIEYNKEEEEKMIDSIEEVNNKIIEKIEEHKEKINKESAENEINEVYYKMLNEVDDSKKEILEIYNKIIELYKNNKEEISLYIYMLGLYRDKNYKVSEILGEDNIGYISYTDGTGGAYYNRNILEANTENVKSIDKSTIGKVISYKKIKYTGGITMKGVNINTIDNKIAEKKNIINRYEGYKKELEDIDREENEEIIEILDRSYDIIERKKKMEVYILQIYKNIIKGDTSETSKNVFIQMIKEYYSITGKDVTQEEI